MRHPFRKTQFSLFSFLVAASAAATEAPQQEIKVTLFGQPCLMQGPADAATLRAIHAISPEQVYPAISSEELEKPGLPLQIKEALTKLSSQHKTPSELDRYREKVTKRLEALGAFVNGMNAARKQHQSLALINSVRSFLNPKNLKIIEGLAGKLDQGHSRELVDQLFNQYSEMVESDPEEEFHRATRKLGVKYACSYEETQETPKGSDSSH